MAGAGTDTVYAAFNHTLASSVERLVLTGSATKGTGNSADNLLVGNAAANTLTGGAGNDTFGGGEGVDQLVGGSGNDKYELGSSSDKITETNGTDTITTTISRSLASYSGIENLQLVGTSDINGSGNSGANTLLGNVGKNQLKAGRRRPAARRGGQRPALGRCRKDKFDFDSITEIGKWSSSRDVIRDFKHGSDKIDLRSIDAKSNVSGNNAFAFVAAEGAKFSGVKGQLIWDQKNHAGTSKDVTLVSGDLNGDKVADFTLELTGLHNLSKGDFIL
jgi:serralysin